MRQVFERLRVPLLFALLVVVSLVGMASDRLGMPPRAGQGGGWSALLLEIGAPIEKLIALPFELATEVWSHYVALWGVREENERLRERLAALERENLEFREALVTSARLARIARMRESLEVPMRPAEVVGQDVSPWFRSVVIDRGRADAVEPGMPVVNEHGAVGLVTTVAPHASRCMLLLDRQSAIGGMVQRTRARGLVRGVGGDRLAFEFAVREAEVAIGDVVLSSGLDGIFPKGLRVGRVVELETDDRGLVRRAWLEPSVDFGRLEQVFVLLHRDRTFELLEGRSAAVGGESPVGQARR